MKKIAVLDQNTIDKIAAGEVVERPASVAKELVENAIDAGADAVTVEIRDGGITFLRITDNGSGIEQEQVPLAFLRHATSKITSAEDLMKGAAEWGHEAIAVTDHGVVQAFPEAFAAAKKHKIKLIPGVEAYLTDDDKIAMGEGDLPIDTPIVVLDFETTGLNTQKDRVIEIGAVKLHHGQVVDSFGTFVNPGMLLPQKIVEITHITDQMLRDAPDASVAIPQLMEFLGDCPIAAHNAKFDCAVLESELARLGKTHECLKIDTLTLARKLYPELKSHRLGAVCKHLHVTLKGAHRAVNDAAATAQCLALMLEEAVKRGASTVKELNQVSKHYTLGNSYHIVLLAASQKGMENINRMISDGHLKYFRRRPHVPRAVLQKYREGVIVGSACESGELFSAVVDGVSDEKLLKMARFYDYLEIQPIGNNAFLLREGRVQDEDTLRAFNKKIVWLGEKLGIPVVATGDVHFLDPKDAVFRAILQAGQGFDDCDNQPPLYFTSVVVLAATLPLTTYHHSLLYLIRLVVLEETLPFTT